MLKHKNIKKHQNQEGFASIVITLILILVLGLITVGFAQLARREQQNALDKQLSTQANDAVESGINDVQQLVNEAIANPAGTATTPSLISLTSNTAGGSENPNACLSGQGIVGFPASTVIDPNTGASYSCVLLNLDPPYLVFSGVSPNAQENVGFSVTGGNGTLDSFTIYWGTDDHRTTPRAGGGFTPLSGWNSPAVLQFSVTPLAQTDRQSLMNNTFTAYLYPSSGGSNIVSYNTANQAQIIPGDCSNSNATYTCSVTVNGLSAGGSPNEQYLVHVLDYYDASNITISNAKDSSGTKQYFKDGQAQIDVTGKAKNVLKREQVYAPLKQPGILPAYTIESQNTCKRFDTAPVTGSNPNGTNYDVGTSSSCNLSSL